MRQRRSVAAMVFAITVAALSAQADCAPTVTQTIGGSIGSWDYRYDVSNTLGDSNFIYFFGLMLPVTVTVTAAPGWSEGTFWNNSDIGGADLTYNRTWFNSATPILPGAQMSFFVHDAAFTAVTNSAWFAIAYGDTYAGADFFNSRTNAGFQGFARVGAVTGAVPEAASWAMMVAGFAGLGYILRRHMHPFARNRPTRHSGASALLTP